MGLIDSISSVAGGLVPPLDAHPDRQYVWRLRVGVVLCGTFVGLICVTLLAFGAIPPVFDGFARKSTVDEYVTETRAARVSSLNWQLLDLRIKHCAASGPDAKQSYWVLMMQLAEERMKLTGSTWQIPPCDAL